MDYLTNNLPFLNLTVSMNKRNKASKAIKTLNRKITPLPAANGAQNQNMFTQQQDH